MAHMPSLYWCYLQHPLLLIVEQVLPLFNNPVELPHVLHSCFFKAVFNSVASETVAEEEKKSQACFETKKIWDGNHILFLGRVLS